MDKEICVKCGKQTEYGINYPIDLRKWYVEGAGQLCEECFHILYPVSACFVNDGLSPYNEFEGPHAQTFKATETE